MVWGCTDELCLVGQPVGFDLRCSGACRCVLFSHDHMCWPKPTDLVEHALTCISPKPDSLAQLVLFVLTLISSTQRSAQLAVSISSGEGNLGSSALLQVGLKGLIGACQLSGVQVGIEEM